jgi:hypothetical protein
MEDSDAQQSRAACAPFGEDGFVFDLVLADEQLEVHKQLRTLA